MSRKKMMTAEWTSTALVAASSSVDSGWMDIGRKRRELEVTSSSTGGTPVLEIDWSNDGGTSTLSTDTLTQGTDVLVSPMRAKWCRVRMRNTSAVTAFTAHSTVVKRDRSVGL